MNERYFDGIPEKKTVFTLRELEAAVLAEREACAKVCIDQLLSNPTTNQFDAGFNVGTGNCAAAIRARGENGTA